MRLTEKLSTTSNKFIEFINELGFDFLDTQKMVKNSLSNTIDDLLGSAKKHQELADLISKQIKKIKDDNFVEKTRIAQQIMNQYSNNASTVSYDLSNNLRNLMQKAINHYELSYIETSNKFSKPVIGSIWPKVNEWLEIVNESSLIETIRTHEISLSLSHEAIDNIFENLRNSLVTFAENDITTLTQKIIGIQTEIKEYLESYSISNYRIVEPKFNFTGKYGVVA